MLERSTVTRIPSTSLSSASFTVPRHHNHGTAVSVTQPHHNHGTVTPQSWYRGVTVTTAVSQSRYRVTLAVRRCHDHGTAASHLLYCGVSRDTLASPSHLHVGRHLKNDDVGDHGVGLVRRRRPAPVHRHHEPVRPLPRVRLDVSVWRE